MKIYSLWPIQSVTYTVRPTCTASDLGRPPKAGSCPRCRSQRATKTFESVKVYPKFSNLIQNTRISPLVKYIVKYVGQPISSFPRVFWSLGNLKVQGATYKATHYLPCVWPWRQSLACFFNVWSRGRHMTTKIRIPGSVTKAGSRYPSPLLWF